MKKINYLTLRQILTGHIVKIITCLSLNQSIMPMNITPRPTSLPMQVKTYRNGHDTLPRFYHDILSL